MTIKPLKYYPLIMCQCGATYRAMTVRDLSCCAGCAVRQDEADSPEIPLTFDEILNPYTGVLDYDAIVKAMEGAAQWRIK